MCIKDGYSARIASTASPGMVCVCGLLEPRARYVMVTYLEGTENRLSAAVGGKTKAHVYHNRIMIYPVRQSTLWLTEIDDRNDTETV